MVLPIVHFSQIRWHKLVYNLMKLRSPRLDFQDLILISLDETSRGKVSELTHQRCADLTMTLTTKTLAMSIVYIAMGAKTSLVHMQSK